MFFQMLVGNAEGAQELQAAPLQQGLMARKTALGGVLPATALLRRWRRICAFAQPLFLLLSNPINRKFHHLLRIRKTELFFDVRSMGFDSFHAQMKRIRNRTG